MTEHTVSVPFDAAAYLTSDDVPGFLAEVLADGDHRALPLALRAVADVVGMTELAARTGLNRETLYCTRYPSRETRAWTRWGRSWPRSGCASPWRQSLNPFRPETLPTGDLLVTRQMQTAV